jgi:hypothetical protein
MVMMRTLRTADIRPQTFVAHGSCRLPRSMPQVLPKSSPSLLTGLLAALLAAAAVVAPSAHAAGSAAESQAAWGAVSAAAALRAPTPAQPLVAPDRYAAYTLDQAALADVLETAPAERRRTATPAAGEGLTIAVPTPDGGFERFAVVDAPVMTAGLAAQRPDLKSYSGRGLDDPTATIRLDLTPIGFHASVRAADGAWYVDPRYADRSQYVAYDRGTIADDPARTFAAGEDVEDLTSAAPAPTDAGRVGEPNGSEVKLRTYRLALVSDNTYAGHAPQGGQDTTAAKFALMTRVDQIYEQELGIRLELIAQTPSLNLDTAAKYSQSNGPCGATACFTAGQQCDTALISRNNTVAGILAGADNYDLAHLVLGIDGGGIAGLAVVGGQYKGRGCTGLPTPIGDYFAVDYVAHEMGHQFGANHTFAGGLGACGGGNANPGTAVEPGSGSSIMAYAGICGLDDLQDHSDPYFSQRSATEISTYVTSSEANLDEQQQAVLAGFDNADSFSLTYGSQTSALITRGANYTVSGLQSAIQALTGATATVSAVSDSGFTVSFSGARGGQQVATLGFSGLSGATGAIGQTIAGGTTRKGGTQVTPTGNHVPDVTVAGSAYKIPARTPFRLDASATDADSDALTYMWEQNDAALGSLPANGKTGGPLFRVFGTAAVYASPSDTYMSPSPDENQATATPWRAFPDYAQVAADDTNAKTGSCLTGHVDCFSEYLPTSAYTSAMHFRVSVRDNHPGGGGVGTADATVTPVWTGAPFRVTSQASASTAVEGASLPVTWNVAGTTANGIDTADVKITMSTDGGQTFDRVLAASTPNDGAATVTVPAVPTAHARIMVQAVGNVFFDISKADLTIAPGAPVVVTAGAASADLGSVTVGTAGAAVAVTFSSTGAGTATTGAVVLGGADAGAVSVVGDACSSRTLAVGASCTVTVRLTPSHAGAQAASLSLPSDDLASPATVALTGTGVAQTEPEPQPRTTPTTPVATAPIAPTTPKQATLAPTAQELAATLLGVANPYKLGSAGSLSLFATTGSKKLGKPKASKAIAVAACAGGSCSATATAKLTLTSKAGKKVSKTITLVKDLRLADGRATKLTLKLSAKDRKAIKAARKATVTLTVTNATKKVGRTYTLTVG